MYNNQLHTSVKTVKYPGSRDRRSPVLLLHLPLGYATVHEVVLHFPPDFLTPNNKLITCVSSTDEGGEQRDPNRYGEQDSWDVFPKSPPRSQPGAPGQEHYYTRGYPKPERKENAVRQMPHRTTTFQKRE